MTSLRSRIFFPLLLACISFTTGKEFTLGLLVPIDPSILDAVKAGKYYAPAIAQAVEDVNNRSDLLAGHTLSFIWNDTNCDESQTLRALSYQIHEKHVDAIIGPGCSCHTEARLASALDIPMISYVSCFSYSLLRSLS